MSDEEFQGFLKQFFNREHFAHCKSKEEKLRFVFKHIDKDGSRSLTHDEVVRLAMKIDPTASQDKIQNSLSFLDKDGSGEVCTSQNWEEICAAHFLCAWDSKHKVGSRARCDLLLQCTKCFPKNALSQDPLSRLKKVNLSKEC